MTKRIFHAICLVATTVFLASVVLFFGVLYYDFSNLQKEQLRIQTTLAAQGVSNEGKAYFQGLEMDRYRITWISPEGEVWYDSKSDSSEMLPHIEREEVVQALEQGMGESVRYSDTLLERSFYCAKRLEDGSIVRLSVAQRTVFTLLLRMVPAICMIFLITLALSLLLAHRLSKKIVEPLQKLNLDEPLCSEGYPELSPLLLRMDAQRKQIKAQHEELLKKHQDELLEKEKSEQMRREFTANVSHELKTPLHAISGCAELLAHGMVKAEDTEKFAGQIYQEAQRMSRLVEDILKLSRLDEGVEVAQYEMLDLHELAEKTVESLLPVANQMGVQLVVTGEDVQMEGAVQLLQGILYNLCDNAIKYNVQGGKVTVDVRAGHRSVKLTVSDSGIGIPREHQERIFERFYRVDKSHSKQIGGTGLGLSIVKHAVRLHQANLELMSEPNQGTVITITFPRGIQGNE